jgi:excisionase family DNA binding protein
MTPAPEPRVREGDAEEAGMRFVSAPSVLLPDGAIQTIAREVAKILAIRPAGAGVRYMTTAQAAVYLGWPAQRLYKLTAAGAIPHRKHRQRLLFEAAELDAWLAGYAHGPGAGRFQSVSTPSRASQRAEISGAEVC